MPIYVVEWTFPEERGPRLAVRPRHRVFLERLQAQGKLVAAGPWAEDDGALIILTAESRAEVERFLEADPYETEGVGGRRRIREWNPFLTGEIPVTTHGARAINSEISFIKPGELAAQAPYAYAAVIPPGRRLVFTAGACPLDETGKIVAAGDFAAQAKQVMDNLETALRAAGAELHHVAKTTVYVATNNQEDLVTAWEVVRERFGDHDAPSTLLGVAVLGYRDQLVEVEAIASVVDFS